MSRPNPHIYEINMAGWLAGLGLKEGRPVTLGDVPLDELKRIKAMGMDMVWLMGAWHRSPCSEGEARKAIDIVKKCASIVPGFDMEDLGGSPYSVYDYIPDPAFGTAEDLLSLKEEFEREGLELVLDFVPNHTACDHGWIHENPEYYINCHKEEGQPCPDGFFPAQTRTGRRCIAHGKDPYFPPWTDTAQLDYTCQETRTAMIDTLARISRYCHGMRCDMAMLILGHVFSNTWGGWTKGDAAGEFWPRAVEELKSGGKRSVLIAEAYWGKERELLDQGFDYVYDKTLYDLMVKGDAQGVKSHVERYQTGTLRFIENHDEPRAFTTFGPERVRCAMVVHGTLPGMRLWHDGQWEGETRHVPVQLNMGGWMKLKKESMGTYDRDFMRFTRILMEELDHPVFHWGRWEICPTSGWPDNQSHVNLMAWLWHYREDRRLIVANITEFPAQGYVHIPENVLPASDSFVMDDPLNGETYLRSTGETRRSGLYVALDGGRFHFFSLGEV